jgi:hypothetical protein
MAEPIVRLAPCIGRPNKEIEGPEMFLFKSESFPNASLDAVAVGGSSGVLARNQDSKPRRARPPTFEVKRVAGHFAPFALAQ